MFSPTIVTDQPSSSRAATASSPAAKRSSEINRLLAAFTGSDTGIKSIAVRSTDNSAEMTRRCFFCRFIMITMQYSRSHKTEEVPPFVPVSFLSTVFFQTARPVMCLRLRSP